MSITKDEVLAFLNRLEAKISVYDIIYLDQRPKNAQTLATLEIAPYERDEAVKSLKVIDYSEGPLAETQHGGETMWVFGKQIKNEEVYIKVSLGTPNNAVICISFHIAELPMSYPFKRSES
ncbi:MAG: hypothetical protein JXR20_12225 [Balneola sp.]